MRLFLFCSFQFLSADRRLCTSTVEPQTAILHPSVPNWARGTPYSVLVESIDVIEAQQRENKEKCGNDITWHVTTRVLSLLYARSYLGLAISSLHRCLQGQRCRITSERPVRKITSLSFSRPPSLFCVPIRQHQRRDGHSRFVNFAMPSSIFTSSGSPAFSQVSSHLGSG
jgi:hypothetical protein